MLLTFEYAPPPPPSPPLGVALEPAAPPPPPPMTSMVLDALFQSEGTVYEVPEVRKVLVYAPVSVTAGLYLNAPTAEE